MKSAASQSFRYWHVVDGPGRWHLNNGVTVPLRGRPRLGWRKPEKTIGLLKFTCCQPKTTSLSNPPELEIWGRLTNLRPKDNHREHFDITISVEMVNGLTNKPFEVTFYDYSIEDHQAKKVSLPSDLGVKDWMRYKVGDLIVYEGQGECLCCVTAVNEVYSTYCIALLRDYSSRQQEFSRCFDDISPAEIRFASRGVIQANINKSSLDKIGLPLKQHGEVFSIKLP